MTSDDSNQVLRCASRLASQLAERKLRLVLAESCTAGNVAGALANVPGISNWLCGSLVVYRNDSKQQWLDIPQYLLDDPAIGPVSQIVTQLLSERALVMTPEADLAAAVTGHVGPGCPAELDGQLFFCLTSRHTELAHSAATRLSSPAPRDAHDIARRQARLIEATCWVLESIESYIGG